MHYRQTIRDALRARATGLPGMTSTPVDSITQALDQKTLPAAAITLQGEDVEQVYTTGDGEVTTRVLRVAITVVAYRPDDLEKMAEALEVRMAAPIAEGVLHKLTGTRFQDPARGEFDFFSLALDFEIRFSLLTDDPSRVAP